MFQLSIIKDTVPLHPATFGQAPEAALKHALNKKYANRVLHNVGLCVAVFDLVSVGSGRVRYGDGLMYYKVTFRMVVFRPFAGEVVLARVRSADEEGVRLTMGFFDDMYIPLAYLPQPSTFDPSERAHFWLPSSEDEDGGPSDLLDSPRDARMYIDTGEVLRVRVESDVFCDDEPGPPRATEGGVAAPVVRERRAPYSIVCSIAEQGLGPMAWWKAAQVEGEEEMMEE